jgi:hypothetical protein
VIVLGGVVEDCNDVELAALVTVSALERATAAVQGVKEDRRPVRVERR